MRREYGSKRRSLHLNNPYYKVINCFFPLHIFFKIFFFFTLSSVFVLVHRICTPYNMHNINRALALLHALNLICCRIDMQ